MDRAGRRPILLSGAAAMAVFLTLTGYWIYIDQAYTPNAGKSTPPGPALGLNRQLSSASSSTMRLSECLGVRYPGYTLLKSCHSLSEQRESHYQRLLIGFS
jgi:hypothetical protein